MNDDTLDPRFERDLRAVLPSLEQSKQPPARLALGMIYLKSAELHRELAQVAGVVQVDYLKRLAAYRGEGRSRYSDLYLGLALLESGKEDAAAAPLERFLAGGGERKYKGIATIALGTAALLCAHQCR